MKEYVITKNNCGIREIKETPNNIQNEDMLKGVFEVLIYMKEKFLLDIVDSENAYVISFNDCEFATGVYHISKGDSYGCNVYNKELVTFLSLIGAHSFIVVHNHTKDILFPSQDDINNLESLETVANVIGVDLLGSYIITRSGYIEISNPENVFDWEEVLCI